MYVDIYMWLKDADHVWTLCGIYLDGTIRIDSA